VWTQEHIILMEIYSSFIYFYRKEVHLHDYLSQYSLSQHPDRVAIRNDAVISHILVCTRVGTLIVATIYLQLIQNRYMFRSFTVLQCSHQHCVQPVASDVEVVGYL